MKEPSAKLKIAVASVVVTALAFLIADCSFGTSQYFKCSVTGHHYKPAWTEVTTSTDSDGKTSVDTIQHSEEFHILCAEIKGENSFDVSSDRSQFYSVKDGQEVFVRTRNGRFTGAHWLPTIIPNPEHE